MFAFCKSAEILFSNFEISFLRFFPLFVLISFFLNYILSSLLLFPVVSFLTITDHLLSMHFHYLYYHHHYYYILIVIVIIIIIIIIIII